MLNNAIGQTRGEEKGEEEINNWVQTNNKRRIRFYVPTGSSQIKLQEFTRKGGQIQTVTKKQKRRRGGSGGEGKKRIKHSVHYIIERKSDKKQPLG